MLGPCCADHHIKANVLIACCTTLQVEGTDVDWVKDADPHRAWLRIINLHYTEMASVTVS